MEEASVRRASSCDTVSSESDDHRDTLSQFGASNSGEPLVAQLLVVDFTPTHADTNYIKNKVIAFWDYIHSRKDLRSLKVKLGQDIAKVVEEKATIDIDVDLLSRDTDPKPVVELTRKQSTAVSMLEFVEGKGLINRIFEAKLQQSMCSLGAREYHEEDPINKPVQKPDAVCFTSPSRRDMPYDLRGQPSSKKIRYLQQRRDSKQAYNLCRTLERWDKNHPKSMAEPSHPPNLSYLPPVLKKLDF